MQSRRKIDQAQWAKFLEHWGWFSLILVIALLSQVFLFFFNFFSHLKGNFWIHLLIGAYFFLLTGAGLILFAKLPAYRSRRFFTFGLNSVPAHLRRHYRWGWGLFLLGVILSGCLLLSHHR